MSLPRKGDLFPYGRRLFGQSALVPMLPGALQGVNFSGREFTPGEQWPVTAAVGYYIGTKKMNCVRLSFIWELVQPTLGGALDSAEVTGLEDQITRIVAAGGSVILDLHNYQRRAVSGTTYIIGETATVTQAHYVDLWTKLATQWKNRAGVMFGLMNEPHDCDMTTLVNCTNAVIAAIRALGAGNFLLVCGNDWSNSYGWRTGTPNLTAMLGITDPINNFAFDIHHYNDDFSSGSTSNVIAGSPQNVAGITTWARTNGRKLFCGETNAPATSAGYAALAALLTHFASNTDVWIGWTVFVGGGWSPYNYRFRLDPYGSRWDGSNPFATQAATWAAPLIDMPQMTVIDGYLPALTPTVNLIPKSRDFDLQLVGATGPWEWLASTITRGAIDGIFGPLSATAVTEDSSTAGHGLGMNAVTVAAGAAYTYSAVVKKGARDWVELAIFAGDFSGRYSSVFNLAAGTYAYGFPTGSGMTQSRNAITSLGNGFYLIEATVTSATVATANVYLYSCDPTDGSFIAGSTASPAYYVDHIQAESGSLAHPPKITL